MHTKNIREYKRIFHDQNLAKFTANPKHILVHSQIVWNGEFKNQLD